MASGSTSIHGPDLFRALTETALSVQRARLAPEVLDTALFGLEKLGFEVVVWCFDEAHAWVTRLSSRPHLDALHRQLFEGGALKSLEGGRPAKNAEVPVLLSDLPAELLAFDARLRRGPPLDLGSLAKLAKRAVVAPLSVRRTTWGALVLMHDDLQEDDLPSIGLFALQLGSAIDVAEGLARLARRNGELDLVHELAASGPQADTRALCRRALDAVCVMTESDAGMLHRLEHESGQYVLVSDPVGPLPAKAPELQRFPAKAAAAPPKWDAFFAAQGMPTVIKVPLAIETKPVGLLTLTRRSARKFGEPDVRTAEVLGVQMASLFERSRLYDESNRLFGDLKTSYDELARTQQELVRHERLAALGELAAVMAHEVRNPLGVIFNSLTTLKRLLRPTGDAEMLLNMVGEEADRLNRIVGDLLDFVRPYELVKKPIAVEPVVASAVDSAAQSMLNANVRVVTEFSRELPLFPLDAHLLKQALVNLIVNAAQAMPKGGTVLVSANLETEASSGSLVLRVRDEGVGLSQRATAKMFQPFFTTKATGTGLGLAVVKRIVDAHQGEITARANDEGEGTTFTVKFPSAGTNTPPPSFP